MGDWEVRRDGVGFDVRHTARKRLQGSRSGLNYKYEVNDCA